MFIIRHKKLFVSISGILVFLSILSISFWGLNLGIDFKGGAITEVSYNSGRPDIEIIKENINGLGIGGFNIQPSGESNFIIRTKFLDENEKPELLKAVSLSENDALIIRYSAIGPVIGSELRQKTIIAIFIVIISIIVFIALAFRHISEPVSSWKYGLIAIITLAHDVIIPTGIFSALGHFYGKEIDILFVTAILSIFGISINDTIVIFDRIRENLKYNKEHHHRENFGDVVGKSLDQTFIRSFNTSFATLLVLASLFFLAGVSTENLILALLLGQIFGTYSSLFLASPLLVIWSGERGE